MMLSPPSGELRAIVSLALLYTVRMLGLFMVLPVMRIYGESYAGSTPLLLGLALGVYGLTQAIFQVPLGILSDFWGRKPVITLGLLIFGVGSLVAALADSIVGVIIGRALQGVGAIASVLMALVADLTSEKNRTKAMAAIGASIGVSFSIAMIIGALLAERAGLPSIFWVTLGLTAIGMIILYAAVPNPPKIEPMWSGPVSVFVLLRQICVKVELLRLDIGVFCLHTILMASFMVLPLTLKNSSEIYAVDLWQIYFFGILLAFAAMVPFMLFAERKKQVKLVFLGAIAVIIFAELLLFAWHQRPGMALLGLFLFFTAFNFLEATLPSLVSKIAPTRAKGTAMGLFSTSQFLGAACGGVLGGWLSQALTMEAVFFFCALLALLWLSVAVTMKVPPLLSEANSSIKANGETVTNLN